MSKQTILMISEKGAWIGLGQDGPKPSINKLDWIEFDKDTGGKDWAGLISKKVSQHRLSKKSVLAVLGPCISELRPITMPPVDKKSLTPIVHIQAKSQLVSVSEKAQIDFCPTIGFQYGVPGDVVASTFSPKSADCFAKLQSEGFSFRCQLPQLLVLENLKSQAQGSSTLWINVFKNQIEFSLIGKKELGVARFAMIPAEGEARQKAITREIVRTLSVISSQKFGNIKYSALVHSGNQEDSKTAESLLEDNQIKAQTVSIADFGTDTTEGDFDPSLKLIALALLSVGKESLIDYANPTKPPKEKADLRQYAVAGLLAAIVVLGLGYWAWFNIQTIQSETADLQKQIEEKQKDEKENQLLVNKANEIYQQISKDPNWLNEILHLSKKMPYGDEFQLSQIEVGSATGTANRKKDSGKTRVTLVTSIDKKETLEDIGERFKDDEKREKTSNDPTSKSVKTGLKHVYSIKYDRIRGEDGSVFDYVHLKDTLDEKEELKLGQGSEANKATADSSNEKKDQEPDQERDKEEKT